MKLKAKRPLSVLCLGSAWRSGNDCGEMPPGFSALAPVRKKVRGVAVCAPADVVDRLIGHTAVSKLKSNQRGKIAMRFHARMLDDCAAVRSTLHLASNFFADLERLDANVGTDRDEELAGIMRKRLDGAPNDTGHRAAPAGMHGAGVPARGMRNQNRYAIGGARSNPYAFNARNERVALHLGDRIDDVRRGDLAHLSSMHLPLLEETIAAKPEALGKARTILEHGVIVIA